MSYEQRWSRQMPSGRVLYESPEAAQAYDNSRSLWQDGKRRAAGMITVDPLDTVLDIGSGPGILSIPLARRAKQVTAIDPSRAMLDLLLRHQQREGITNISMIESRWEEVDYAALGRFDVVIASYSLSMSDIRHALSTMQTASRKRVYLYWFNGQTSWEKICCDLYPAVHNRQFSPLPKADLLYGVLSEMGISANVVNLSNTAFDHVYANTQTALAHMRRRLGLKESDTRFDTLLHSYILDCFQPEGTGWRFRDTSNYVQIMWELTHEE